MVNETRAKTFSRSRFISNRFFFTFHFELVPVGTFEHDPLFSLINYRSRLATPRTNFSYYPGFQELAHDWVAKEPPNKFRLRGAEERIEPSIHHRPWQPTS